MTACKGDIWLANLNPQKRANEVGKLRPVLVIQSDLLNHSVYPTTVVMPLTTQLIDDAQPLRYRIEKIGKLNQDSDVLIGQIRAIDNSRFVEKLSSIDAKELQKITALLFDILD